jgi:outer membrane cobalamin receptor
VSSDYTGDLKPDDALLRRPEHSGNASITWARSGVASLSGTASFVGERPDMDFTQFPSPVVMLPAYAKVDLAGSVEVYRRRSGRTSFGITARIENALDREYEDVLNFPAPGRTLLMGARISGSL